MNEEQSKNLLFNFKNLLDFYFGEVSIDTIMSFTPNVEEINHDIIINVAHEMGLMALSRDINANEIPNYFFPCLIFDKNNNSFVLLNKTSKEATLYDSTKNEKIKIANKDLKNFTNAILVFRDKNKLELLDKKSDGSWFWQPIKSYWRSYLEIGILTFFINIFALAVPLFTMSVYDRVIPNNAVETLFVLAVGVGIILVFDIIFKSARNYIIEKTGKRLGIYLEEELMKRVLHLQSKYDSLMTGSKANLFRELAQVRDFFATKSIVQVIDLPFFFIAVFVIFLISPAIAVVPLFVSIFILVFNVLMQIPMSNLSKKNIKNTQSKHSYLVETIQGSEIIKLSNASPTKLFKWRNIVALTDSIALKIQSMNALSVNLSQTVVQFVTMCVIVVGVFEIAAKELSVGGLIAVTILSSRAMVPVIHLSMMVIRFKEIKESLNSLDDFWNLPIESEKNIEIGIGRLKGEIELKNVSYYYKDSKYASLENINLKINPGDRVGIIGQTGAGKSTILRLLTGLDTPTNGSVYLDNHDISTIHPVEIRKNIGVMTQEPYLFSGSLKENIELSQPISKERMMELIKITGLEALVKKSGKGDGLDVGERGSNLSVGQRHLVAMARAILNDPPIMILDEPTTGLDVGLEKSLINNMKQIMHDKTLIVITHRFAALELVDRVIVLNDGKIVADGAKDAVLKALQGKK